MHRHTHSHVTSHGTHRQRGAAASRGSSDECTKSRGDLGSVALNGGGAVGGIVDAAHNKVQLRGRHHASIRKLALDRLHAVNKSCHQGRAALARVAADNDVARHAAIRSGDARNILQRER
jgi:hypothetical protein